MWFVYPVRLVKFPILNDYQLEIAFELRMGACSPYHHSIGTTSAVDSVHNSTLAIQFVFSSLCIISGPFVNYWWL